MNLAFLILADHSEALNGKLYAMGGGWNTLRFPSLPREWAFTVAFAVDVPWDETNRRHRLSLQLEDPDGGLLGDPFAMEFEAGRPPGSIPGQDQRIVLSMGTQNTFAGTGPHAVVVKVNDEEIGRARFQVIRIPAEMLPPELRSAG